MSKKRMVFPMEVQSGSVTVKLYRVENKGRDSFTVSFHADGRRRQKMFADFEEAHAEAKSKAAALSRGELDVLELRSVDSRAYVNAVELLNPIGVPLELAVKDYVEAWKVLGGKASLLEAAKDFARRHMHELPSKLLPDAVDEMIEIKKRDGTSEAYMKVLRVYLTGLKKSFHCQVRTVTSGQLADYFRNMQVSSRSKNNARGTVGAFFKFCKERGWLPRDHEGISLVPKFKEKPTDIEIFAPWEVEQNSLPIPGRNSCRSLFLARSLDCARRKSSGWIGRKFIWRSVSSRSRRQRRRPPAAGLSPFATTWSSG